MLEEDLPLFANKEDFVIFARPEGSRCLILSGNGRTIARDFRGVVLAKFQSALPGGSSPVDDELSIEMTEESKTPAMLGIKDDIAVLDCIFNKQIESYFVIDILQWGDTSFREYPQGVRLL